MRKPPARFLLDGAPERVIRIVTGTLQLAEGVTRSWVTLTRSGSFTDPRYGRFVITPTMLADMVRNFDAGTYGQEIFIDVAHEPEKGAAAKVLQLKADGNRLRAELEWTPYGIAAVRERGFRYLSADFFDDYVDNEAGRSHGPLLRGAGLTIRPVIKRLDPVQLAESDPPSSGPVYLAPGLVRELTEHLETTMNKWLEELKRRLGKKKLAQSTQNALIKAFESTAKVLGEDESALEQLVNQLDDTAKTLDEGGTGTGGAITLSVNTTPSGDAIAQAVAKALTERDGKTRQLAETTAARVKQFDDALSAAKGLSEPTVKLLGSARDLITADMTEDQVKRLAENQIALGNQMEAQRQLAGLGLPQAVGSTHITVDESNSIKRLAEHVRKGLQASSIAGELRAPEIGKESTFAARVLAEFDRQNGAALHREAKQLDQGAVNTGDTSLPPSYQREVIRESLHDLRILDLVGATVDPTTAATHNIPYETRDKSQIRNGGIVYEGQAIHKAGISQSNWLAYIVPMKLALEITNEAMFFTRNNGLIAWDAYARNLDSNARAMRELMVIRIANDLQRNADAYGAVAVANEDMEPQFDGARTTFKTAQWPIVRPHQVRDLQGNAVGSATHPITVSYDGGAITEWDGTGEQAAGEYFRITNWNLGYFQIVDEAGDPIAVADTTVCTMSYSYATNVAKVDIDVPEGTTYERHMNKLLQAVGARKAALSSDRYVMPNFGLMSPVLHNMITDAENFEAQAARPDVSITSTGTLGAVKGIPQWDTNAPSIDLGDERLVLGRRGDFRYTVAKPFSIGVPFEVQDSSGRPLGKKAAYGEEYSSLCVPERLREGYSSVIAYSATARTAV